MIKENAIGYLPDERPPLWKLLLYAIQQVIVMFPATITVALITGFHVSTTIFASGLATICFILITGRKIPMYYGSSFAYLSAIGGLMASKAMIGDGVTAGILSADTVKGIADFTNNISPTLPIEAIQYAQFGIVLSGLISIAAGILVKFIGPKSVEKILPPTITGPIALIIGLTLAGVALQDAAPGSGFTGNGILVWAVSLATLLSTILFTKYLKGFLGQLPLLLGVGVGCAVAAIIYFAGDVNLFKPLSTDSIVAASTWKIGDGSIFALPAFSLPKASLTAVLAIMPIAIATIPESTAHIYQLDIYVNDLAAKKGKGKYGLDKLLHKNLIGDGIGDMVTGFIGGPAGTNYGENISTMAITRVFSVPVIMVAGIIAMVIACFTPLIRGIYAIPTAVIGGIEIYLFGAIAAQGIAIMIDKKVDMFSSKNIAVIASILIIGLGGNYAFGGNIPLGSINVPCIAGAAIFGILLNLLLSIGDKKKDEAQGETTETRE